MRTYVKYGGMKPGEHAVISEAKDHKVVKWRGHNYCVPNFIFSYYKEEKIEDEDEDEEEYDYDE